MDGGGGAGRRGGGMVKGFKENELATAAVATKRRAQKRVTL